MNEHQVDRPARRAVLKAGLSVFAVGVAATSLATTTKAQAKVAQAVVQYQTTPKDGAMCSGCVNFAPPSSCNIVEGAINPNGWCVAYAPKNG